MLNGRAYVHLAADFANVIDQRANYIVLVTPEGDNRGMFVTNKTMAGFAIQEIQGGRSTLSFGYHIIAKRFGEASSRLPMVAIERLRAHRSVAPPRTRQ